VIGIKEVFDAKRKISAFIRETPLLHASSIDAHLGFPLYLKAECFQKTGSFKIRGAANFLLQRQYDGQQIRGVVAASSGNHGQAVAYVAGQMGIPATIVMPEGATPAKVKAAIGYGAVVEFCGTTSSERLERAKEIAQSSGYIEVPPYDHPDIIAGQGTLGVELIEQNPHIQAVFVPIGGGGLISGTALAIKELRPDIKVYGVEPVGSNSMYVSMKSQKRTKLESTNSIADGLLTLMPGEITYSYVSEYVDDIVLVEEEEIKDAMRVCLERYKVMTEPSGAVSMAAALKTRDMGTGCIAAVLSGGNTDLARLGEYLKQRCD
jgi:threonine dehydratase